MNIKTLLRKSFPHFIALFLFVVLAYVYNMPVVEGKRLKAHDTDSWRCMAEETLAYNKTHEDVTLWTNSMFGGMPTYQITMAQPNNFLQYPEKLIHAFPRPVSNLILYLFCFYLLLIFFDFKPWLALVGAIGFTFASYNLIIIAAGHNTKAIAIAYIAPLIGAVFLAFRKKPLLGSLLTALFLGLAIRANHIQILYYTLILLIGFAIVEFIYSIKEKTIKKFLKTSGLLIIALIVALGINATSLMTTSEYSEHTMRGKSNGLTTDTQSSQEGLNKDYITQWSYGVDETMTLLIPNFKGGASSGTLKEGSATGKYLKKFGVPNVSKMLKSMPLPLYWGTQPFTSGPVYIGAVIIFLFVLGLFVVDNRIKWWLLPIIILTMMLSWGKNFMPLTDFFIDYIPLYNKFRTVSMILVITGFGVTLLAFLSLKEFFQSNFSTEKLTKALLNSTYIVGGLLLLFVIIPSLAGNFVSVQDIRFQGDYSFLRDTLPLDRKDLLRSDAIRSLVFVLLTAGVLWLFVKDKLKKSYTLLILGGLVLLDLFPIAKRYLNSDNFENQRAKQLVTPTVADNFILKDKTQFRVLNLTKNIFNDATPSYFHKNIGGYHAAKLRRYQELINMQLDMELRKMTTGIQKAQSLDDIYETFQSLGVLNMLNMKYVIVNEKKQPISNPYANGNAWLVHKINIVEDANEEMEHLGKIDTKTELVVDKNVADILPKEIVKDTTATISLQSYQPNRLVYHFNSQTDQVAVFSEIFYDKGWVATINGVEQPYTRVNYLLRGMPLKAGNYDIEFCFSPKSYFLGNTIALISSILLLLGFLMYVYFNFIYRRKKKILSHN